MDKSISSFSVSDSSLFSSLDFEDRINDFFEKFNINETDPSDKIELYFIERKQKIKENKTSNNKNKNQSLRSGEK